MRKLVKILLSLVLAAPAAALALGVGEVQLHSALNQRLDAEIKLLSVDPAEADTIEASLASYDDFARVGLERPSSLMFLRFKVEQSPSGEYYIKLSSREAIREPFLDFLVEVKWRSGRVLREYTLLLDPPVSHQEPAPSLATPVTTSPVVDAPVVQARAAEEADEFVAPPSAIPAATEPATGQKTPDPRVRRPEERVSPAAQAAPSAPAAPAASSESIVYGPVKANETLWSIARKLRRDNGITDQQMMMALLIANPYAFVDNNINRLKKGYVLRIDDLSVLTAMSKAEASREVSRQTRAWQDYRAAIAARAVKRESVTAAQKTPSAAIGTAKKEPKLELVTPDGKAEQPGKAAEGVSDVKQELMLAMEGAAAQRKENEELQKRVEGLEERLQDMQRLLTLKDSDLAALQDQLAEQGQALSLPSRQGESADVVKAAPEVDGATEPKGVAPAEPGATVKPAEPAVGAAPQQDKPAGAVPEQDKPAAGGEPEQVEKAPDEAAPAEKSAPETAVEKPAPVNKPAVKKPPVVIAPPEEPGFVDTMFGMISEMGASFGTMSLADPMIMAIGGAVLLILLLLLLKVLRSRGGGFQESILTGGSSSMMGAGDELNNETSFLSDLAISGMGKSTIHSDEGEVDPLTEADVFMAYGRHQQAEEVLSKALDKHPERLDVSSKLLDVYYNLQDKDKFVALASRSADSLKSKPGEWDRIAVMGRELVPENALFAATAGAVASAAFAGSAAHENFDADVLDIGLDLDELTSEMEGDGSGNDSGFDLGLDFDDLDEDETPLAASGAPQAAVETSGSDFEFDLDLGDETVEESAPVSDEGFNFDLGGMDEVESTAPESTDEFDLDFGAGDIGSDADELSLDFSDAFGSDDVETADDEGGLDLGALGDLDFGDLGGLEENTPQAESAEDEGFDLDMSELESIGSDLGGLGDLDDDGMFSDGDGDEIATKLDLAQAYIEMGDNDGARSMLEEIVEGGNDDQKQQAQALLARI